MAALAWSAATPRAAESVALLGGRLLDSDGRPAVGFLVVAQDVFSGHETASTRTADDGGYRIQVPAGSRYRLFAAVEPGGKRLDIEPKPEIDVPAAGDYALPDVACRSRAAERPAPVVRPPWYRSRTAAGGFAAGGLALLAVTFEDGGGEQAASPSSP